MIADAKQHSGMLPQKVEMGGYTVVIDHTHYFIQPFQIQIHTWPRADVVLQKKHM